MRYDTPIYFQTVTKGAYDKTTGNYAPDEVHEVVNYANVSDTSTQSVNMLYGDLNKSSLVIRIRHPYNPAFDYIRIGDKRYKMDLARQMRKVFTVSEVK